MTPRHDMAELGERDEPTKKPGLVTQWLLPTLLALGLIWSASTVISIGVKHGVRDGLLTAWEADRAAFSIPERPFEGYCGLAGKPE